MTFEYNNCLYSIIVGSDVIRDGMYVEVTDDVEGLNAFLEIFYSDITSEMTISLYRETPLPVVEWAIGIAKERLLPLEKRTN
jgi:hypothetical protein